MSQLNSRRSNCSIATQSVAPSLFDAFNFNEVNDNNTGAKANDSMRRKQSSAPKESESIWKSFKTTVSSVYHGPTERTKSLVVSEISSSNTDIKKSQEPESPRESTLSFYVDIDEKVSNKTEKVHHETLYHSVNVGRHSISHAFLKGDVVNTFPWDVEFEAIIQEAEMAIEEGVDPELIKKGSSGSYFVRNRSNEIIGVFKPRDEEPYSELNPKWGKYIQRKVCCCCFGRGCLVINHGYLSEAGASLVDDMFELNVVPKTRVVCLASKSFNYRESMIKEVRKSTTAILKNAKRIRPGKAGSFQLFVKDYQESVHLLQKFDKEQLPKTAADSFQQLFERLVALDYIIRNTDRGPSNWLVRYEEDSGNVKLAAIDNGLAFPFKHPDETRAYPFHWATLPQANKVFSDSLKEHLIPKLKDPKFVQEVCSALHGLFKIDKGFNEGRYEGQMAVMRGQMTNLLTALQEDKTPAQLAAMRKLIVKRRKPTRASRKSRVLRTFSKISRSTANSPETTSRDHYQRDASDDSFEISYPEKQPCFSRW